MVGRRGRDLRSRNEAFASHEGPKATADPPPPPRARRSRNATLLLFLPNPPSSASTFLSYPQVHTGASRTHRPAFLLTFDPDSESPPSCRLSLSGVHPRVCLLADIAFACSRSSEKLSLASTNQAKLNPPPTSNNTPIHPRKANLLFYPAHL